jgi:hypothetical protein
MIPDVFVFCMPNVDVGDLRSGRWKRSGFPKARHI